MEECFMKILSAIAKIVATLAFIAGVVYLVATYGDKIVAWAKKILNSLPKCPKCEEAEAPAEEVVEQPAAEEAPAAE